MTTLYTLPALPLHFILQDDEDKYWIVPATMTGQPATPYLGPTTPLAPVPAQTARVLMASWTTYAKPSAEEIKP